MVAGILVPIWLSAFAIWVAIALSYRTSVIQKIEQGFPYALGGLPAIFAHPHQCGPAPRPKSGKNEEPGQLKLPILRDKAIEIRQLVSIAVADSLHAIKRNAAHLGQPRNPRRLHVHQSSSVGGSQAQLLGRIRDSGTGHQPTIVWGARGDKAFPGAGVDNAGNVAGLSGRKLLAQGSRPAGGDDRIDGTILFDFGKGACGRGDASPGAGGNPLALVEAPTPEMHAVRALVPPTPHQRLQLACHRRNDCNSCHAGPNRFLLIYGAYPFARNHSIAAFMAGLMGTMRKPNSCCARALEAYIFLRPIRTSSSVALGSRPRMRPVIHSSKNAYVAATAKGILTVGDGMPVIADILSSICLRVRFSPPRMCLCPGCPLVSAATCARATSATSTRFSPVST